ncbi:Chromosome partition protein Smc [Candidatus Anstonella stagnisolia]|nr:Chromosome partition protein Smc [Candidatus Anstonella stagnisolia]
MALDDLLISTGVDALIRLVKEKKKIELPLAAKELSLPVSTVEEWARVLEGEGIIAIKYQLTKAILVWLNQEPAVINARAQKITEQKKELLSKVSQMQRKLESSASELDALEKDAKLGGINSIEKRASMLVARIEQLSALRTDASEQISSSKASLDALEKKISSLSSSLGILEGKSSNLSVPLPPKSKKQSVAQSASLLKSYAKKLDSQAEDAKGAYDSVLKKIAALQKKLEDEDPTSLARSLRSDLELAISSQKQLSSTLQEALLEQKGLQEQISRIANSIKEMERSSTEFDAKKFRSQLDSVQKSAEGASQKVLADLEGTRASVDEQLAKIEALQLQEKGIGEAVSSLRKEFNELSEHVLDTTTQLKQAAETFENSISPELAELEGISGKLSDISLKKVQIEKLAGQAKELRMQHSELSSKLSALEKESNLLGILSDEPAPPSLVEKINLTSEEEAEFDKKREELRSLIKKMWDEDKK